MSVRSSSNSSFVALSYSKQDLTATAGDKQVDFDVVMTSNFAYSKHSRIALGGLAYCWSVDCQVVAE